MVKFRCSVCGEKPLDLSCTLETEDCEDTPETCPFNGKGKKRKIAYWQSED